MSLSNVRVKRYVFTGIPAYSNSAGTVKKCRCKRGPAYSDTFFTLKTGLGIAKTVTVTGVSLRPVSL